MVRGMSAATYGPARETQLRRLLPGLAGWRLCRGVARLRQERQR
jgi:hypothetical protein